MGNILNKILVKRWILIIVPLVLIVVVFAGFFIRCEVLNSIPEALIYPNSVKVGSETSGIGRSRSLATYFYETSSLVEDVIHFYSEQADCSETEETSNTVCRGTSEPFGEYFVYIESSSGQVGGTVKYVVELRWHGCSLTLE